MNTPSEEPSAPQVSAEQMSQFLAAAMRPGIEPEWLGQIVQEGLDAGLPMAAIYMKRSVLAAARGVDVPGYEEVLEAYRRKLASPPGMSPEPPPRGDPWRASEASREARPWTWEATGFLELLFVVQIGFTIWGAFRAGLAGAATGFIGVLTVGWAWGTLAGVLPRGGESASRSSRIIAGLAVAVLPPALFSAGWYRGWLWAILIFLAAAVLNNVVRVVLSRRRPASRNLPELYYNAIREQAGRAAGLPRSQWGPDEEDAVRRACIGVGVNLMMTCVEAGMSVEQAGAVVDPFKLAVDMWNDNSAAEWEDLRRLLHEIAAVPVEPTEPRTPGQVEARPEAGTRD